MPTTPPEPTAASPPDATDAALLPDATKVALPLVEPAALAPLWRQREYMLLWGGQVVSNLGAHASGIVYPLLILAITQSPAAASWATVLRILPYLLLSLPVGALIDRWNRRLVMIVCHAGRLLVVATLPVAMWADVLTLEHIYVVAVLEGGFHVFFNIAETAALPRVVAIAQLPQATGQNQAGFGAAAVVGPALGAWLMQAAGRAWPFVLDAVCHLAGLLALWRMRTPFEPRPSTRPANLRAEMAEGLRWLWRERLVRDMALITGALNAVQAAVPLLLIVLAKQTGAGEAQTGLLFSIGGAGAILGAVIGPAVQRRFGFGPVIIGTLVIQALLFPLYVLGVGPLSLGLVYALIMFFSPIYNVVQFSYRIALIPDGLQGRVNSSFRLVAFGLNPAGALLCGWLLEHHGSNITVAVFGSCWALIALAAALNPAVRNAPKQPVLYRSD